MGTASTAQLIQRWLGVGGPNKTNVPDWSGEDRIPKLQPEAERSNNVQLDGAAAPRAAIDAHSLRRCALSVKPSTPHQEVPVAKHPERIKRILRRNRHAVARAQVPLSDLFEGSRVVGNCFQRLKDAGQHLNLRYGCCAALDRQVNESALARIARHPLFNADISPTLRAIPAERLTLWAR
jgi:hypothetical protein